MMGILLLTLAIGAGIATFIENDYGAQTAQILIYKSHWYETVMVLTIINMLGAITKFKMWRKPSKFLLHFSFVIILLGASITRYIGFEGIMHIREGETSNTMVSTENYLQIRIKDKEKFYYKEYKLAFGVIGNNYFEYKINFNDKILHLEYIKDTFQKQDKYTLKNITLNATINKKSKAFTIVPNSDKSDIKKTEKIGDTIVSIDYGPKTIKLPFSIKLRDFQLDRYPGSNSPSSYASEVTVYDEEIEFDYRIFMNTTLQKKNYLFFQSSYDMDERGTILSVNNDPGKWPTYFGYFILTLGLLLNLFDKKGRFFKLTSYLKTQNLSSFLLVLVMVSAMPSNASNLLPILKEKNETTSYLRRFKNDSKTTALAFGKLVTQSNAGRMQPLNSLNVEIVRKISSKSSLFGMNEDQIVLGMLTRPEIWRDLKMIKVKTPKLKKILNIDPSKEYISFSQMFQKGNYVLTDYASKAIRNKPNQRGTFQKDILAVDERVNIAYMTYSGNLLKIIPKRMPNKLNNNKWFAPLDAIKDFTGEDQKAITSIIRGFINSVVAENWEDANKYLSFLTIYQEKVGSEVILNKKQIQNEIIFNKLDIFSKLTIAYVVVGFLLFFVAFTTVFNQKLKSNIVNKIFFTILAVLFFCTYFWYGI